LKLLLDIYARGSSGVRAYLRIQKLPDSHLGRSAPSSGLRAGRQTTGSREFIHDVLHGVVRTLHLACDLGELQTHEPEGDDPAARLPRQGVAHAVKPLAFCLRTYSSGLP